MSTTPGDFQISDRVRRELYMMIRDYWKRVRPGSGPGFERRYPLAQGFTPSYGGMTGSTTAATGQWTTVLFTAALTPVTSDITLNAGAGTITLTTAGVYMVHASLSLLGLTEEFEYPKEDVDWTLAVAKNAGIIHSEKSHIHGSQSALGGDATGHCAFSHLVEVAANDVLTMKFSGPLDDTGLIYCGSATHAGFSAQWIGPATV